MVVYPHLTDQSLLQTIEETCLGPSDWLRHKARAQLGDVLNANLWTQGCLSERNSWEAHPQSWFPSSMVGGGP